MPPTGLNRELDRRSRYHGGEDSAEPWLAHFTVKQLSPGRELIELEATWDDDRKNIGWYEAENKVFRPRFYKFYFGPGLILASCAEATLQVVLPAAAVAVVILAVAQTRKRRRAPAA